MKDHPLQRLENRILGECRLHLQKLKSLRLSGWRGFSLVLKDRTRTLAQPPVVEGIYSAGGWNWGQTYKIQLIEGNPKSYKRR